MICLWTSQTPLLADVFCKLRHHYPCKVAVSMHEKRHVSSPSLPLIGLTCALTHVPPAAAAKKLSGEKEKRVYNCHFFHWQNEARENGRMRHSKHDIGVLQEQSFGLDFFLSDHTLSMYQPEILILIIWQCHPCARAPALLRRPHMRLANVYHVLPSEN